MAALTHDESLIARLMFINRVLKADGEAFQKLFWAVMREKHLRGEFIPVRPQGSRGDGGVDACVPTLGHYYQIYGPLEPLAKIGKAAEKLKDDFQKIKKSWDSHVAICQYSFVFNDKYEGSFPEIVKALTAIRTTNRGVKCSLYCAHDLEDDFITLDGGKVTAVLGGPLPVARKPAQLDVSVLRDVILNIMSSPVDLTRSRFGELPSLDEKIQLNNLCSTWRHELHVGARRSGYVDHYFSKNSRFAKQDLSRHVKKFYKDAVEAYGKKRRKSSSGLSQEDVVFSMFKEAMQPPNPDLNSDAALMTVIAYYFEACDVFKHPTKTGSSNASS